MISQSDANTRIAAAYLYKDSQCQTNHSITIPVFTKARGSDVDLCVLQLLNTDCLTWSSDQNVPAACLAISIQL